MTAVALPATLDDEVAEPTTVEEARALVLMAEPDDDDGWTCNCFHCLGLPDPYFDGDE